MSLPDYRLDPPDEHEVECWICGGIGRHAISRDVDTDLPSIVECEDCEGSGRIILGENEYDSYLKEMKHAD